MITCILAWLRGLNPNRPSCEYMMDASEAKRGRSHLSIVGHQCNSSYTHHYEKYSYWYYYQYSGSKQLAVTTRGRGVGIRSRTQEASWYDRSTSSASSSTHACSSWPRHSPWPAPCLDRQTVSTEQQPTGFVFAVEEKFTSGLWTWQPVSFRSLNFE
jgi:hypothetical protein